MGFVYRYYVDKIRKDFKYLFLFLFIFLVHPLFSAIYTGIPADSLDTNLIIDGTVPVTNFRYEPASGATLTLSGTIHVNGFFHIHSPNGGVDIVINSNVTLKSGSATPAVFELSGGNDKAVLIKQGYSFTLGGSGTPLYMVCHADPNQGISFIKVNNSSGPDSDNSLLVFDTDSHFTSIAHNLVTTDVISNINFISQGDATKPDGNNGALVLKINDGAGFISEFITCNQPVSGNNIYTDINWQSSLFETTGFRGFTFFNFDNRDSMGQQPTLGNTTLYSSIIIENNNTKNVLLRNYVDPLPVLDDPLGPVLFSANTAFSPFDPLTSSDLANYSFATPRYGFILGRNTLFLINSYTYIMYVGGAHNYYPQVIDKNTTSVGGGTYFINYLKKQRNNSALIVDCPRTLSVGSGIGKVSKAALQNPLFDFSTLPNFNINVYTAFFNPGNPVPDDFVAFVSFPATGLYFASSAGVVDGINQYQPSATNTGASVAGFDYGVPAYRQPVGENGHGNIVFDGEGKCVFVGINQGPSDPINHIVSILSDEVELTGDFLIPGDSASSAAAPLYPKKKFPVNPNDKKTYGKACMLFGDNTVFGNITLLHTDSLHNVFLTSGVASAEPCYIGGDHYAFVNYFYNKGHNPLTEDLLHKIRPKIYLNNSRILVANEKGFASAGLDWVVTSSAKFADPLFIQGALPLSDQAYIRFLADGTSENKYIILGTENDGSVVKKRYGGGLDFSSNLDVFLDPAIVDRSDNIGLEISTGGNNSSILPYVNLGTISSLVNPIGTIYLGGESNINISGDVNSVAAPAPLTPGNKTATVTIDGKFINIASENGLFKNSQLTGLSRTGEIIIGKNGIFRYTPNAAGNLNATISRNYQVGVGTLNPSVLIPQDILSVNSVGIEDYDFLSDSPSVPGNFELLSATTFKPTYVFDSRRVVNGKGYNLTTNNFGNDILSSRINDIMTTFPSYYRAAFENMDPFTGLSAANSYVNIANISKVPYISGRVGKLVLIPSSSSPLLEVNGGKISSIIFNNALTEYNQDSAFTATLILSNDADVAVGSSSDLFDAPAIGSCGLRFIVRNNARIEFNTNTYISGTTPFMSTSAGPSTITIDEKNSSCIIVPRGQVFDLTALQPGSTVRFIGNASLILEDGACIAIPTGVTLEFNDLTKLIIDSDGSETVNDQRFSYIVGGGTIAFKNRAELLIPDKGYLSISSLGTIDPLFNDTSTLPSPEGLKTIIKGNLATSIRMVFNDSAKCFIGDQAVFGGAFQVGNRVSLLGGSVRFKLELDGSNALFKLGKKGFLGLNAGILQKNSTNTPGAWSVGQLNNVANIDISLLNGVFDASQIASSTSQAASLIAFGNTTTPVYNIRLFRQTGQDEENDEFFGEAPLDPTVDPKEILLKGGSNLVVLGATSPITPIVDDTYGILTGNYQAGILTTMYHRKNLARNATNFNSSAIFNFAFIPSNNYAAFSTNLVTGVSSIVAALKNSNKILRLYKQDTFNLNADDAEHANLAGAVGLLSVKDNNVKLYVLGDR